MIKLKGNGNCQKQDISWPMFFSSGSCSISFHCWNENQRVPSRENCQLRNPFNVKITTRKNGKKRFMRNFMTPYTNINRSYQNQRMKQNCLLFQLYTWKHVNYNINTKIIKNGIILYFFNKILMNLNSFDKFIYSTK